MVTKSCTAALAASVTLLVGCVTGPRYSPPAQPSLQSYTGTTANSVETPAASRSDAAPGSRQTIVLGSGQRIVGVDFGSLLGRDQQRQLVAPTEMGSFTA